MEEGQTILPKVSTDYTHESSSIELVLGETITKKKKKDSCFTENNIPANIS